MNATVIDKLSSDVLPGVKMYNVYIFSLIKQSSYLLSYLYSWET